MKKQLNLMALGLLLLGAYCPMFSRHLLDGNEHGYVSEINNMSPYKVVAWLVLEGKIIYWSGVQPKTISRKDMRKGDLAMDILWEKEGRNVEGILYIRVYKGSDVNKGPDSNPLISQDQIAALNSISQVRLQDIISQVRLQERNDKIYLNGDVGPQANQQVDLGERNGNDMQFTIVIDKKGFISLKRK